MKNITGSHFHGGKETHQKGYQRLMIQAVDDGRISEDDARQMRAFFEEIQVSNGVCAHRIYKLAYQLVGMRKWVPEFSKITKTDFYSGIAKYRDTSEYADSTQSDMIKILKRFLLWLVGEGEASPLLDVGVIKKVKVKGISVTKTADDVLTPSEIDALFKATTNTRNRALLEVLYESMGRAREIATMRWSQITFHDAYASVQIDGKTGKVRAVPLYTSHVMLRRWKDQYNGGNPSPDDLVFPSKPGGDKPLTHPGMTKIAKTAAKRAGINKNVKLHTFRHSKITHLLQEGLSESSVKMLAWGDIGTQMLKVYAHLTMSDAARELMEHYDILPAEAFRQADNTLSPIQCACGMLNPQSNEFCGGCGVALRPSTAANLADMINEIDSDPQMQELLAQIFRKVKTMPQA